jgi:hypothetical protein
MYKETYKHRVLLKKNKNLKFEFLKNFSENKKMSETRPGDWKCMGCNFVIFARKDKCAKCQLKKGETATPEEIEKKKIEKREEKKREKRKTLITQEELDERREKKEQKPKMTREERDAKRLEKLELSIKKEQQKKELEQKKDTMKILQIERRKIQAQKNQFVLEKIRIEEDVKKEKEKLEQERKMLLQEQQAINEIRQIRESKGLKKDDESCVVCFERATDVVLKNCNHFVVCGVCAHAMDRCPICRTEYNPDKDIGKIYTC